MRVESKQRSFPAKELTFTFDGKAYIGREGDTLAAALLANGVKLVGRSFKYHRPRGILTAGSEEPNALVKVADEPNLREVYAFVMNGQYEDAMMSAPSDITPEQLKDLHIKLDLPKAKVAKDHAA